MRYSISLRNLPFEPDDRQVIYVENHYDEYINTFIRANYEWMKWTFRQYDIDFIYLPLFFNDEETQKKVLYYAPYLTSLMMESVELRSSFLLDFMSHVENREKIPSSLLFSPKRESGEWIFQGISLDIRVEDNNSAADWLQQTLTEINDNICKSQLMVYEDEEDTESHIRFRTDDSADAPNVEYSSNGMLFPQSDKSIRCDEVRDVISYEEESGLEEIRDENIEDVIESLEKSVKKLRLKGMSLSAIYELIRDNEKLSRLHITEDLRIFLPDYNNKEVKLSALYKAVYFLFLNHPEGIVLQRLEDHHRELANYYRQTSNKRELTPRMLESIKKLEVYDNNTLNIILSKIKSAFFSAFDEHLAKYYIITGKAGGLYKIELDNRLIEWEDEYE